MKDKRPVHLTINQIADHLAKRPSKRLIVAIAGPPGVGKSTVAKLLAKTLNKNAPNSCAVLAMDGFHFDDIYLEKMNWRARKGAPHTFDVGGLAHTLSRLRTNQEPHIAVPVFDRAIEIARAGAYMINQQTKIILVEGNYLLLDQQPWQRLRPMFDTTIMLTCKTDIIHQRLRARWVGFNYTDEQIAEKMNDNDIPNVTTVVTQSAVADFEISTDH